MGLLSDDLKWLEHRSHTGQKASAILQSETYDICHSHNIKLQEIKAIIVVSGPGFYTGLRLSEGFADIFKVFKVPCYSFYSYEIPKWCGHDKGVWMTKAYRGEYFFHEWADSTLSSSLILTKDLPEYLKRYDHVFIHSLPAIDQELKSFTSTNDLLKNESEKIFNEVLRLKLQRDSYYFRAPEDEFRVSV